MKPLEETFEVRPVHATDEVAVVHSEAMEGAVREPDDTGLILEGLVAAHREGIDQGLSAQALAEPATVAGGDRPQAGARLPARIGLRRLGEQVGDELVVSRGHRDRQLSVGCGYLVAGWLGGIIVNLLTHSGYYDIALRDFGLLIGALALGRLAAAYDPPMRLAR